MIVVLSKGCREVVKDKDVLPEDASYDIVKISFSPVTRVKNSMMEMKCAFSKVMSTYFECNSTFKYL